VITCGERDSCQVDELLAGLRCTCLELSASRVVLLLVSPLLLLMMMSLLQAH
jgi:hypothetical protein